MGMRETVGSMRTYLALVGVVSAAVNIKDLVMWWAKAPLVVPFALAGLVKPLGHVGDVAQVVHGHLVNVSIQRSRPPLTGAASRAPSTSCSAVGAVLEFLPQHSCGVLQRALVEQKESCSLAIDQHDAVAIVGIKIVG